MCRQSLEILLHVRKLGHLLLRVTYTWPRRSSHVCRVFRGPSNVQVEQATARTVVDLHRVTLAGLYVLYRRLGSRASHTIWQYSDLIIVGFRCLGVNAELGKADAPLHVFDSSGARKIGE
jgi:hypothetical protein